MGVSFAHESCVTLKSLFDDCCVVDVWRALHPDISAFSWMRSDGALASRIDLVGCPYAWLHCVESCSIEPCPYSDHCAVLFKCAIPSPLPRGPGRWKLNTSILRESAFIFSVQSFWTVWRSCKSSFPSLQAWWDKGKDCIKGLAIRWSSAKNRDLLSSRSILVSLASHLKSRIDAGVVSLLHIFENVQSKIKNLDRISAEGARIRSRVRWAEEGEMSSKFFLRLEKKRGSDGWISAMRETDGSLATDISSICSSWVSFYSKLFTAEPLDFDIQDQLLSRLVHLIVEHSLPRMLEIAGYLCRVWYRGQPLVCNLCARQGHKSANCPNKFRRCGESGHFARSCPQPWGNSVSASAASVDGEMDSQGSSPQIVLISEVVSADPTSPSSDSSESVVDGTDGAVEGQSCTPVVTPSVSPASQVSDDGQVINSPLELPLADVTVVESEDSSSQSILRDGDGFIVPSPLPGRVSRSSAKEGSSRFKSRSPPQGGRRSVSLSPGRHRLPPTVRSVLSRKV